MSNIPRISINEFNLTIQVDSDHQQKVQGQMEHALAIFPNMLTNRKKRGLYKSRYALTTPNGQVINIEANPAREGYHYLKLSYSPANLSQDETELLANYLNEILGPSYREDFYSGRLQRIQVSFDLRGLLLSDLWIYRVGERDKKVAMICNADVAVHRPGIGAGSGAAARPARRSAITPAR